MNYWLIKSEPTAYSIDDLKRDKRTAWEGVRNYQARNYMQQMAVGDLAIFYHSSAEPTAAVGVANVVGKAQPDASQFDRKDSHYDPKATKDKPIWFCPTFAFKQKFNSPVSLSAIKADPALRGILVAQQGSRLSVQPLSKAHFEHLCELGTA